MDHHQPEPGSSDPTLRLNRDAYYAAVHTLRTTLPQPLADTQEELTRRDNAAIAQVAAMLPANADEANLAAGCVAARLYAMDCIRQAREFTPTDTSWAGKCAAQAISMMRESRQARSLLLRLQTAREKREADPAATERATWSEYCTIGLMTDSLAAAPPAPPAAPAKPTPPAPAEPAAEAEPRPDLAAEAELYAVLYPRRAKLIRSLRRLPDNPDFGPPRAELVAVIVNGTTPALLALDDAEITVTA